ncbi:MAG: hypothetical protein HXY22_01380 [Alphaproteobacteria bacterium]|nr:hypothetical protein [Alphaproteobacteria bacterium]
MFVGHYGPALAGKAIAATVPLWLLFLAVQLFDVAWSIFILTGIEHVRLIPGFMALSPLDLYYMPYTHGLITALVWSIAFAALYMAAVWGRGRITAFLIVTLAVFSHWVLDFLVHTRDLPLIDNRMKVGLGLWNFPQIALPLEAAVLVGGMLLYVAWTKPKNLAGRIAPWAVLAFLAAIHAYALVQPLPKSAQEFAATALASFLILPLLGLILDRTREAK